MEIKITCGCGQKYIFEVNPVNGQMPVSVQCPVCGADGTQEANDILAQIAPEMAAVAAPAPVLETVAAPVSDSSPAGVPMRLAVTASPPPLPAGRPPLPPAMRPSPAPAARTSLVWYEHVWTALPLGLVAVGGCIGGGIGGAAWAVNRQVFLKLRPPIVRYVVTGLISVAAVIVWLAVVSLVLSAIHRR